MYISDFVYLFICPWILALLALVGSHEHAAMHMVTQISIYVYVFNFEGYISRSRIGESYGNFLFNYLRKCYTVLHDSYTILHLLRQCKSLLIFLHNHQHCYLLFFLFVYFNNDHYNGYEVVSNCRTCLLCLYCIILQY